ncbi:MAG TPA: S41 family peptidase [Candidatus Tumulicola sp.]|nr:S41 family peptidase [Candidatus Tumulicola sp.]
MKKLITGTLFAAILAGVSLLAAPARAADDVNKSMLDYSFLRATIDFYKQVDYQALLDGAVSGFKTAVKNKGGDPTHVPVVRHLGSDSADIAALNEELKVVNREYGRTVGERELAYGAISGMMQSLRDRWTVFMTPQEYRSLNENLEGGGFPGVGVVIDVDPATKSLLIVQVLDGGPAAKAGMQPGDVILTIDGTPTKGLSTVDDSKLIRGKAGTKVQLVVQRVGADKQLVFSVTRDFIHEPSVLTRMIDDHVGYVRVLVFGTTTGDEITRALAGLEKQGVKAYILDLRNNGGGYLNAAIDVASKFVADGPIVEIDQRQKPLTTINAQDSAVASRPLAVLVNGYTASASEIASGAIQDSGTGVLIGTKTYGKGEVQTIYPLPDGSAIKITTARYLTPSGRDINTIGIKPDIEVPDVKVENIGNLLLDSQLQRAVSFVRDQLTPPAPAPVTH